MRPELERVRERRSFGEENHHIGRIIAEGEQVCSERQRVRARGSFGFGLTGRTGRETGNSGPGFFPGILRMTEFSSIDSPTCCHLHRWHHVGHYLQQRTAPDWACAERQIRLHSSREIHPGCLQRFAVPSRGMLLRRLRPSWRTSQ